MPKTKKKGFTLIELLVVIAIIGLLATLSVVALNNARERARDSRRVSDIKQIQTALELYFNSTNGYPATASWDTDLETAGFLNPVPEAPTPADCTNNDYAYTQYDGGSSYCLQYCLASDTGGLTAGDSMFATEMTIYAGTTCPH
jgi:prepilin-type N-terminal cleavage/methylation domain-containing protein